MQFSKSVLVIQQNNYVTKIVNVYIVYDLDNLPKNLLNNFTLKKCLFGGTNIVKNSHQSKYMYGGFGFGNDFARNVIIFGVDNSLSSHADKHTNKFLLSGEGPTDDINLSFSTVEKKFSINFTKAKTKFCLSVCYNGDNSYVLHVFCFYKKNFYKKMSFRNPKTLRKCYKNFQPQMPHLQFLKALIFARAL